MNWLITGGCGFIGRSLIAHIFKNNTVARIRVIDNFSVGKKEYLAEVSSFFEADPSPLCPQFSTPSPISMESVSGDIRYFNTCLKCCKDIDLVFHLAANTGVAPSVENPRYGNKCHWHLQYARCCLAKQCKKIHICILRSTYRGKEPPITEDKPPRPVSPYGANKLAGEGYCSAYIERLVSKPFLYVNETTMHEIACKIKEIVDMVSEKEGGIIFSKPRTGDVKRNYSDI